MIYGSVCSGIEAATAAWHPLGWNAAWYSEIEPFPCAVLGHHYPETPNLGDMTKFKEWPEHAIDLLVGGTPCQSFSVAGLRKGLDDPRGNLMLTYLAIAGRYRPRWLVWENVPGVLSIDGGRAFGTVLGGLGQLGYGFAYRVLDAQYFGVPQRRRRVFVVGCLGGWRLAAAVLFERHSLQGHPAPSREKGEDVAASLAASAGGCNDPNRAGAFVQSIGVDEECNTSVEQFGPLLRGGQGGTRQAVMTPICMETGQASAGIGIGTTLNCNHEAPIVTGTLNSNGKAAGSATQQDAESGMLVPVAIRTAYTKANEHGIAEEVTHTLDQANGQCVAFQTKDNGRDATVEQSPTILRQTTGVGVGVGSMVRRLTPRECERLQGFPTMIKRAIIAVCLDHQKSSALVEIKCLKSQSNALIVGEEKNIAHARSVDVNFWNDRESQEALVALHVRQSHGMKVHAIRSLGRWLWCANGAEHQNLYLPSTPKESFAHGLVRISQELENLTTTGRAGLQQHIKCSLLQKNGSGPAVIFGRENEEFVKDAADMATEAMRFITSNHGQDTNHFGLTNPIWLSSVLNAISSCIPAKTPISNSFKFIIDVEHDYTLIPWRGKKREDCPDGPRYKALGNSMAVPVMRWIGQRIAEVEQIVTG